MQLLNPKLTFNCHSLCRALSVCIPKLTVVTGGYRGIRAINNGTEFRITLASHSWLKTPDKAIIDPYPVGVISYNPLLVPADGESIYLSFGSGMYDANCSQNQFKKKDKKAKTDVHKLVRFWRRKLKQLHR